MILLFGKRVRHVRIAMRGWTQGELGQRAGITISQISQFEIGNRTPSLKNIQAIINALGVSADYLLGQNNESDYSIDYTLHNNINRLSLHERQAVSKIVKLILNSADRDKK